MQIMATIVSAGGLLFLTVTSFSGNRQEIALVCIAWAILANAWRPRGEK